MNTVSIVALVAGAVGLVGGIVGVWVAMRTATRVAVKVIAAMKDGGPALGHLERRVHLLEDWRHSTPPGTPPPSPPNADT